MIRLPFLARILKRFTDHKLSNTPDMIIGDPDNPYLLRWWLIPRNRFFNIYLHLIVRSDDDRALHDHPWWSLSCVLAGGMVEILSDDGSSFRYLREGDVVLRNATTAHRLSIPHGGYCRTLFITGPRIRSWGFYCPQGWRHWKVFTASGNPGQVGRRCE